MVVGPGTNMGPGTLVQSEEMPLVLDAEEQAKREEEMRRQRRQQEAFQHPTTSVDSEDFDDTQEKLVIANLTWYVDDPAMWQSEAIGAWCNMVKAMNVYNQMHLNQQIMVQEHYPELFEYLASQPDTFLTDYELETGKEDKQNTIQAHEEQATSRLDEQEGRVNLPPEVQQYMVPGSGAGAKQEETGVLKIVHQAVQILRYEQGLLNTVLAEADYGESDLMDNHNTVSEGSVRFASLHECHHPGAGG